MTKYLRLGAAAALSFLVCMIWSIDPVVALVYLALTALIGEYIFPLLIHLSSEVYELNQRWSEESAGLYAAAEGSIFDRIPGKVRIYVMDDDSPIMTWVGWRTLIIGRGCYNLDHAHFLCAMQESAEQRINLRSLVFLLSTVGNLPYLVMRLFCRFGYLLSWVISLPLALIFSAFTNGSFSEGYRAGQLAGKVANSIYNFISWLFLRISNLAVYIPFWPLLIWGDHDTDRTLAANGQEIPLRSLMDKMRMTHYNSPFMRERPLILRAPTGMRLNWLAAPAGGDSRSGGLQHVQPQTQPQNIPAAGGARGGLQHVQPQMQQQGTAQQAQQPASIHQRRIRIIEQNPPAGQAAQRPADRPAENRRIRIIDNNNRGDA